MGKKPSEHKTLYEVLREGGMDEEISQRTLRVAVDMSNMHRPGTLSEIMREVDCSRKKTYTLPDVIDSLRILEIYGYAAFNLQGKYYLTEKGEQGFK